MRGLAKAVLPAAALCLGITGSASATQQITPAPAGSIAGAAGHLVEFRKAPAGFISGGADPEAASDELFALPISDANVIADATDNGVAVINYTDSGGGNDFANPRDVGIPPETAVKRTDMATGGPNPNSPNFNSGTFNSFATDDEFAMVSKGVIYIPAAGSWTFVVKSDDGARLQLGTNNAVVTEHENGRTPAYGNDQVGTSGAAGVIDSVAVAPSAGYYPYRLLAFQGSGGAMVQFTAAQGSAPEPTDGSAGFLPAGSQLVGDTASGGLTVYQSLLVSLTTRASKAAGQILSDTATLINGTSPIGTITFKLYAPDNPTCSGAPIAMSIKSVNGNGTYKSNPFAPTPPGTYRWVASYSGDGSNAAFATSCGDPNESVVVVPRATCKLTPASSRVSVSGSQHHQKGVLKLKARCNQAARLTLTGKVKQVGKPKPFRIGAVRASAAANKTLTLTPKLPKAALADLMASAHESASFTLTAANSNGTSTASAKISRLKLGH